MFQVITIFWLLIILPTIFEPFPAPPQPVPPRTAPQLEQLPLLWEHLPPPPRRASRTRRPVASVGQQLTLW